MTGKERSILAGVSGRNRSPVDHRFFLIMAIFVFFSMGMLAGCGGGGSDDAGDDGSTTGVVDVVDDTDTSDGEDSDDGDTDSEGTDSGETGNGGEDGAGNDSETAQIILNGDSITESLSGATAVGSELTISSAGTYSLTGTLDDGRIVVDTEDEDVVRLIFDGVDISCSDSAPVFVQDAEQVEIVLQEGSENFISDATSYVYEGDADEPNAAIHSKDSLSISGSGALTVAGNYNDGITSKDGLIINGGTITVNAVDDGIRGKDYIVVKNGNITVVTDEGDGLLSDNEGDAEKGYITIEGGEFDVTAGGDAIQAETLVTVYDGDFSLTTGGDSGTFFSEGDSEKGIKGVVGVLIEGGSFFIDAADDGIHANDFIEVDGGSFDISTGDDGIHADNTVDIFGGDFSISESYEGIESSVITISDGNFYIVSSDDGLNCAGGNDGSGFEGPGGGFTPSAGGDYALYIDGGYLAMYAQGDGLDSNGDIEMTGGTVLVHGPTSDWNGALDYMGSFDITGGLLVAAGSSGMAESTSESSTQYSVLLNFSGKDAGTLFHVETGGGEEILTFKPSKSYESVVFSSPDLSNGTSYAVYSGGSATGTLTDGLYSDGIYSPGTLQTDLDFTIRSMVTTVGADGGGGRR